jgi:hypothetical protein
MTIHKGSCHCGAVSFEVTAPEIIMASQCNCSICKSCGFLHLIVEKDKFKLLSGEDMITTYTFNTKTAKHTFCSKCGIKSFYTPRTHPDGVSVNVNCLDLSTVKEIKIEQFDGGNWEQAASKLT